MLKIPLSNPYYAHPFHQETFKKLIDSWNQTGSNSFDDGTEKMKLVTNENVFWDGYSQIWKGNMTPNKWYLFPEAFSLHLTKKWFFLFSPWFFRLFFWFLWFPKSQPSPLILLNQSLPSLIPPHSLNIIRFQSWSSEINSLIFHFVNSSLINY